MLSNSLSVFISKLFLKFSLSSRLGLNWVKLVYDRLELQIFSKNSCLSRLCEGWVAHQLVLTWILTDTYLEVGSIILNLNFGFIPQGLRQF